VSKIKGPERKTVSFDLNDEMVKYQRLFTFQGFSISILNYAIALSRHSGLPDRHLPARNARKLACVSGGPGKAVAGGGSRILFLILKH